MRRFGGWVGGLGVFALDGFIDGFGAVAGCGFGFGLGWGFCGGGFIFFGEVLGFCFTPPGRARYGVGVGCGCRYAVRVGWSV